MLYGRVVYTQRIVNNGTYFGLKEIAAKLISANTDLAKEFPEL